MTSAPALITLHDDEAADLAWLLGEVEDWLLHTDELVLGDLDRFLGPAMLPTARAADIVERLGHYSSMLGRRRRGGSA
jgi:hypothetical protein